MTLCFPATLDFSFFVSISRHFTLACWFLAHLAVKSDFSKSWKYCLSVSFDRKFRGRRLFYTFCRPTSQPNRQHAWYLALNILAKLLKGMCNILIRLFRLNIFHELLHVLIEYWHSIVIITAIYIIVKWGCNKLLRPTLMNMVDNRVCYEQRMLIRPFWELVNN